MYRLMMTAVAVSFVLVQSASVEARSAPHVVAQATTVGAVQNGSEPAPDAPPAPPTGIKEETPDPREQVLVPPWQLDPVTGTVAGTVVPHTGSAPSAVAPVISVQGILGADISEYQGDIDWPKFAASNKKFVFIRASYGDKLDAKFSINWKGAHDNGMIRGPYHYFNPQQSVNKQIRLFVNGVHRLEKGDLPPVLDLESPKLWRGIPQKNRVPLVLKWLEAVEKDIGVKPILYMSPKFLEGTLGVKYVEPLRAYPVWLAHYEVTEPLVPSLWGKFLFWQYSETGACDGVTGKCDQDIYPGSLQDLQSLTLPNALEAAIVAEVPEPPPAIHHRRHGGHGARTHNPVHKSGRATHSSGNHGSRHCHRGRCR